MLLLADTSRTATQATIKRATLTAQREVEQLDAQALKDLQSLYKQAATNLSARIAQYAGPDGNLALGELRNVLAQVEARLAELSRMRDILLHRNLTAAADLGVAPYAGTAAALSFAASMQISQEALRFVRSFVAADGLQLSDRIWRIDRGARDVVVNAIEQAVIQGHGASQAAAEFLARGGGVPIDVQRKVGSAQASRVAKQATSQLFTGTGSPMDNAKRLFRTEINRAHGEAYMMGGQNVQGFAGWRYKLSLAHPRPDICDLLSTQNLYGLGSGVYPSREKCPWPAHPNILSFIEIVFAKEVTEADRAGKETPMEALARLTPEQRAGALGKGKAEIFDQGNLRQGMIRTPLSSVRKRIGVPLTRPAPEKPIPVTVRPPRPAMPAAPKTLDDFIRAGRAKADELIAKAATAGGSAGPRLRETLLEDLRAERSTERQAKLRSGGRAAVLVKEASTLFPDDWTHAADRFGPLDAKIVNGRASYLAGPGGEGRIRSYDLRSSVHEYAHRLQQALPGLDDLFQELHHRRTEGDPVNRLRDLIPGSGYGIDEVTREDKYLVPYQGREYRSRGIGYLGRYGALEVMSMGFEYVLGGQKSQLEKLLAEDREMLDLVIGLLYHYAP